MTDIGEAFVDHHLQATTVLALIALADKIDIPRVIGLHSVASPES
jgi:hypothetical protein